MGCGILHCINGVSTCCIVADILAGPEAWRELLLCELVSFAQEKYMANYHTLPKRRRVDLSGGLFSRRK